MSEYEYETSKSDEVYSIDNEILQQFNEFNAEYAKYVRCNYNNKHANDPTRPPPLLDSNGNQLQCSADELNGQKLLEKYNKLNDNLIKLNSILTEMPTKSPQNKVPDTKELKDKQKRIAKMRTQIDKELNELNEYENSIAFSKKKTLDSTIYASLLWTTAATILILFVFTRL
jgi:hypothetical protein